MRTIYMAHPLAATDVLVMHANISRAKRWYLWIASNFPDVAIIADWIISCEVLDDRVPENRAHGMKMNRALLKHASEIWLCGGRISNGMNDEKEICKNDDKCIVDLTFLGPEPPEQMTDEIRALCGA